MRKPLVCMRGFRGRGWGDRGGGPDPPCENSNNNFTYFYFFLPKTVLAPHPTPLGQTIIIILGKWIHVPHEYEVHKKSCIFHQPKYSYIDWVGVSICFVSFDNFPFIFLLTLWLFVRIAFIQYVNVWKSLILVIFKREKLLSIIG